MFQQNLNLLLLYLYLSDFHDKVIDETTMFNDINRINMNAVHVVRFIVSLEMMSEWKTFFQYSSSDVLLLIRRDMNTAVNNALRLVTKQQHLFKFSLYCLYNLTNKMRGLSDIDHIDFLFQTVYRNRTFYNQTFYNAY